MTESRFLIPALDALKARDALPDNTRIVAEIATAIGCVKRHGISMMTKLKDAGLAHICSYVEIYGRAAAPAWRAGPGEDALHPGNKAEKPAQDWRESTQFLRVAEWLKTGKTGTAKQIGAAIYGSESSVSKGLGLMAKTGHVVIVEIGSGGSRVFAWATDENRNRPPKRPKRVKLSVYRRNKRKELVKEHGEEVARKIHRTMWGKDRSKVQIIVDGKVVYQRRSRARKQQQGEANHV